MGLFDFFKKKDARRKQASQNVESKPQVKITTYNKSGNHISFTLAGTNFCDINELDRIDELEYAESLVFVAEPENPYDSNAIMVQTTDGIKIGYVPKDIITELSNHSPNLTKLRCVFTKKSEHTKPFVSVYVEFL